MSFVGAAYLRIRLLLLWMFVLRVGPLVVLVSDLAGWVNRERQYIF